MTDLLYHKGARYEWSALADGVAVQVEVIRVATDQSWADLRCTDGAVTWSKRQALPLPDSFRRVRRPGRVVSRQDDDLAEIHDHALVVISWNDANAALGALNHCLGCPSDPPPHLDVVRDRIERAMGL